MATVNFSVPEEIKKAFDKAFAGKNKSAVLAELMHRAVHEKNLTEQREHLFRRLQARRNRRPAATAAKIRAVRLAGRP